MANTFDVSARVDFSSAERDAQAVAKRLEAAFSKITLGSGGSISRPLGEITGKTDEFAKSMAAANARVIAFGASAGVILGVKRAIEEMIESTVSVQKSLIEMNVLFNTTTQKLEAFSGQLFEVAKNTGQTFKEVASGATELARQGLGTEETIKRITAASILSRQAGIGLTDSVDALTGAVNSFNKTGLDAVEVVNKLANVDASFAVSSRDLAEGLKRVGASADSANIKFDELVGLITSVQQTTARGGAVIGNAFKTIFDKVQRPEIINQLRTAGVEVDNLNSNLSPTVQLLTNVANKFNDSEDAMKAHLAELTGNVYQMNILKALFADLAKNNSIFEKSTRKSAEATNEAYLRNEEYNKSLDALLKRAKVTFSQIGSEVGKVTIAPALERITSSIGTLMGAEGENAGDELGKNIGTGVLKGLGEFIKGPGLALLILTIGKIGIDFSKFLVKASQDFLNLNKTAHEQADLQEKIALKLKGEPALVEAVNKGLMSQNQLHAKILAQIETELALTKQMNSIASTGASRFLNTGALSYDKGGILQPRGQRASHGLIPNFVSKDKETSEVLGAALGGYHAGAIKEIYVEGVGKVIYNSSEKVKDFGMGQPAIMPPSNSKAGQNYKEQFKNVHGFDPYAATVPNFNSRILSYPRNGIDQRGRLDQQSYLAKIGIGPQITGFTNGAYLTQKLTPLSDFKNAAAIYEKSHGKALNIEDVFASIKSKLDSHKLSYTNDVFRTDNLGITPDGKIQIIDAGGIKVPKGYKAGDLQDFKSYADAQGLTSAQLIGAGDYRKVYSVSHGLIPNFSPLGEAIKREVKAGVPHKSVRVGVSAKLKSPNNPLGLGVYNTQDEPYGLDQGISRAVKQGINPKKHGIPNFAATPYSRTRAASNPAAENKLLDDEARVLGEQLAATGGSIAELNNVILGVKEAFKLSKIGAEQFKTAILEAKRNIEFIKPPGKLASSLGSNSGTYTPSFLPDKFKPTPTPAIFDPKSLAPKASFIDPVQQQKELIEAQRKAAEAFGPAVDKIFSKVADDLNDKFRGQASPVSFLKGTPYVDTSSGQRAFDFNPTAGKTLTQGQLFNSTTTSIPVYTAPTAPAGKTISPVVIQTLLNNLNRQLEEEAIKAASSIKSYIPGTEARSAALALKETNPDAFRQSRRSLNESLGSKSFLASLVLPIAGGVINQAIGDETTGARGAAATVTGATNIASLGALGFGLAGPAGAAVGAGFGLLTEIPNILNGFTDTLPELQKNLEKAKDSAARASEGMNAVITSLEKLQTTGLSTKISERLNRQLEEGFSKLNPDQQKRLRAITTDTSTSSQKKLTILSDFQRDVEDENAAAINAAAFRKAIADVVKQTRPFNLNSVGAPIAPPLGFDLNQQEKPLFDAFANTLVGLKGANKKGFIQNLQEDPKGAEELVKALGTLNASIGTPALKEALAKQGIPSEVFADLDKLPRKPGGLNTPNAGDTLLSKFFNALIKGPLNADALKGSATKGLAADFQKSAFEFAAELSKLSDSVREFDKQLELRSRSELQSIAAAQERRSAIATGFNSVQENFSGPKTLLALREAQGQIQTRGERNSSVLAARVDLAKEINSVVSESVLQQIATTGSKGTQIGQEFDTKELLRISNQLTAPILSINKEIQAAFQKGDEQGASALIGDLIKTATVERAKANAITAQQPGNEQSAAAIKYFDEVIIKARDALAEFNSQVSLANQKAEENNKLQQIEIAFAKDNLAIQQKLSLGGGIQKLLFGGEDTARAIGNANFKRSVNDSTTRGQGAFELGDIISSLGAELPTALRDEIKAGLKTQIGQTFDATGVSLTSGNIDDIAETQIKNRFKTESDSEKLVKELNKLTDIGKDQKASIATLVDLAKTSGLLVKIATTATALAKASTNTTLDGTLVTRAKPAPAEPDFDFSGKSTLDFLFKGVPKATVIPKNPEPDLDPNKLRTQLDISTAVRGNARGLPVSREDAFNAELQNNGRLKNAQEIFASFGRVNARNQGDFARNSFNSQTIQAARELAQITAQVTDFQKVGEDLEKRRIELLKQVEKGTIDILEAEKQLNAAKEQGLKLVNDRLFAEGKISGSELRSRNDSAFQSKVDTDSLGFKDVANAFSQEFAYNSKDAYQDLLQDTKEVAGAIKTSFSDAFKSFADGTKSAKDAFRDFGLSILKTLQDKAIERFTDQLFASLLGPSSNSGTGNSGVVGGLISGVFGKANGGLIQKYGTGGKVKGGSGVRDDVPALLTAGEFVIKKSAVDKYGEEILTKLNGGGRVRRPVPQTDRVITDTDNSFSAVFANEFFYSRRKRPARGRLNVSDQLSTYALNDENNPQNARRQDREVTFREYQRYLVEEIRNRKKAVDQFERGKRQRLTAAYIQAAVQIGGSYLGNINTGAGRAVNSGGTLNGQRLQGIGVDANGFQNYADNLAAMGGLATSHGFRRYAGGGRVFGANSPTDTIPALLTGGEYVLNKDAVNRYGIDFVSRINNRSLDKRSIGFAQGGAVGGPNLVPTEIGGGNLAGSIDKLIAATDSLRAVFESKKNKDEVGSQKQQAEKETKSSGGGSVSIVTHIHLTGQGGSPTVNTQTRSNSGNAEDEKNAKKLSELINKGAYQTILDQKKPGGLLEDVGRR
jgi:TP901 family phage tail tape measure protein